MRNSALFQTFLSRYCLLGFLAIVLAIPYCVPPLLDYVLQQDAAQSLYLLKPVDNQLYFLILALFLFCIPYMEQIL